MTINYNIVNKINQYIGVGYKQNWYVGIATYPTQRLFDDHNVDKTGRWICEDAITEANARDTEKHLLDNYIFKGGAGGGISPRYVYAYEITANTKQ